MEKSVHHQDECDSSRGKGHRGGGHQRRSGTEGGARRIRVRREEETGDTAVGQDEGAVGEDAARTHRRNCEISQADGQRKAGADAETSANCGTGKRSQKGEAKDRAQWSAKAVRRNGENLLSELQEARHVRLVRSLFGSLFERHAGHGLQRLRGPEQKGQQVPEGKSISVSLSLDEHSVVAERTGRQISGDQTARRNRIRDQLAQHRIIQIRRQHALRLRLT